MDVIFSPLRAYRAEAVALGLDWQRLQTKFNMVATLPNNALTNLESIDPKLIVAMWRVMPVWMCHGRTYAMQALSESHLSVKIDGCERIMMTVRDDAFGSVEKPRRVERDRRARLAMPVPRRRGPRVPPGQLVITVAEIADYSQRAPDVNLSAGEQWAGPNGRRTVSGGWKWLGSRPRPTPSFSGTA
jgi:hypothetical protein